MSLQSLLIVSEGLASIETNCALARSLSASLRTTAMTSKSGPGPKGASNQARQLIAGLSSTPAHPVHMLPPGYIHLGVAREIVPILEDFGIAPDGVIREAGLDPSLFSDAASVIPHAALGRLLSLCVARTRCSHFGLLVGQRATILSLGMVGRLMQHSDTVGDAIRALVANLSIQNRGAVPSLTLVGDTALFTFSVYQAEAESADQISDGSLAVAVNAIRALCGANWSRSCRANFREWNFSFSQRTLSVRSLTSVCRRRSIFS